MLLVAGCSDAKQQATFPQVEKKLNAQHQFKVHGCAINYNGTNLYMNSTVKPWIKALGKNYRKVDSTDGINLTNLYIYDEIGVRLVERKNDKQIDSFRFRLERPTHDIKKETEDILIQIGFLQNDLILCRIRSGVLIICAVLAVIAVLASQTLPFYIFGIIMLALMVWSLNVFIKRNKGVNQLYRLYDKLSRL